MNGRIDVIGCEKRVGRMCGGEVVRFERERERCAQDGLMDRIPYLFVSISLTSSETREE